MEIRKKASVAAALVLVTASAMLGGCGLATDITSGVAGGITSGIASEITSGVAGGVAQGVMNGVNGMVGGIVEEVMDQVFDSIIENLGDEFTNQKQELIAYNSNGDQLYTLTDNETIIRRVQNLMGKVLQWKRQIEVPQDAQLLYTYELWQEDQRSTLPVGERPIVHGATASLYEVGNRYYLHATLTEEEGTTLDGWYIPSETAENAILFTIENTQ